MNRAEAKTIAQTIFGGGADAVYGDGKGQWRPKMITLLKGGERQLLGERTGGGNDWTPAILDAIRRCK